MKVSPTVLILGCSLLLACFSTADHAQLSSQWRDQQYEASRKSEAIMHEAETRKSLLARYQVMRFTRLRHGDEAFQKIFNQYLSWYQTFIADYPDASATFSIRQGTQADDSSSPLDGSGYTATPAIDAIAELAKTRRAVFFNEAHNVPLTRTLTVELLGKLRAEGFNYFAAETLYQTDNKLQSRGYPIKDSGFYTEEPIYAEMVRTALKLGFKVIAYEATSDATGNAREKEQAENIYRQVFKDDPNARLVLNAGYAHIQKSGKFLGGVSMAEHLRKLTNIEPLSIDQTIFFPHESHADDHPYYETIIKDLQPSTPIVFMDAANKPWSLRPGYDVSVIFPPQKMVSGRPTWASLDGLRLPYFVSGERCEHAYPCIVEARYLDEGPDAIPADLQVLDPMPLNDAEQDHIRFHQEAPHTVLYLRPGKYRVTYSDQRPHILFQEDIDVASKDFTNSKSDTDPVVVKNSKVNHS